MPSYVLVIFFFTSSLSCSFIFTVKSKIASQNALFFHLKLVKLTSTLQNYSVFSSISQTDRNLSTQHHSPIMQACNTKDDARPSRSRHLHSFSSLFSVQLPCVWFPDGAERPVCQPHVAPCGQGAVDVLTLLQRLWLRLHGGERHEEPH